MEWNALSESEIGLPCVVFEFIRLLDSKENAI